MVEACVDVKVPCFSPPPPSILGLSRPKKFGVAFDTDTILLLVPLGWWAKLQLPSAMASRILH